MNRNLHIIKLSWRINKANTIQYIAVENEILLQDLLLYFVESAWRHVINLPIQVLAAISEKCMVAAWEVTLVFLLGTKNLSGLLFYILSHCGWKIDLFD